MDKLLTLDEVAEVLRTPPATMRYWRHRGIGPASFLVGRRVIYTEQAVQDYLTEQQLADPR